MDVFETETSHQVPWVQYSQRDRKKRYFGICPDCRNAVQLIGMEAPRDRDLLPHGRHKVTKTPGFSHSLDGLLSCRRFTGKARTDAETYLAKLTPQAVDLLHFIPEHFHLMVEIFRERTGLILSRRLAADLLQDFLVSKRYRWPTITNKNIAILFAYIGANKSIYGQKVVLHSSLMRSLSAVDGLTLSSSGQVISRPGRRVHLDFGLRLHRVEDDQTESIEFYVLDMLKSPPGVEPHVFAHQERLIINLDALEQKMQKTGDKPLSPYASDLKSMASEMVAAYLASGASRR